jgi:hypothetical protein
MISCANFCDLGGTLELNPTIDFIAGTIAVRGVCQGEELGTEWVAREGHGKSRCWVPI